MRTTMKKGTMENTSKFEPNTKLHNKGKKFYLNQYKIEGAKLEVSRD